MKGHFFIIVPLMLSDCGVENSRELSSNQKRQIQEAVKKLLKDPDSAKFDWYDLDLPPGFKDGAFVEYCFRVNAKNGFGGFVGFQQVYAMFPKGWKKC